MSAPLSATFGKVSQAQNSHRKAKPTKPFSIRLTAGERAYLEKQAGSRPLGAYIREKLLDGLADNRCRNLRKPSLSDGQYASLLAALGESRLSSNLNQLAKHANNGTLDVSDDIQQELHCAYEAVMAMRQALFTALGLQQPDS